MLVEHERCDRRDGEEGEGRLWPVPPRCDRWGRTGRLRRPKTLRSVILDPRASKTALKFPSPVARKHVAALWPVEGDAFSSKFSSPHSIFRFIWRRIMIFVPRIPRALSGIGGRIRSVRCACAPCRGTRLLVASRARSNAPRRTRGPADRSALPTGHIGVDARPRTLLSRMRRFRRVRNARVVAHGSGHSLDDTWAGGDIEFAVGRARGSSIEERVRNMTGSAWAKDLGRLRRGGADAVEGARTPRSFLIPFIALYALCPPLRRSPSFPRSRSRARRLAGSPRLRFFVCVLASFESFRSVACVTLLLRLVHRLPRVRSFRVRAVASRVAAAVSPLFFSRAPALCAHLASFAARVVLPPHLPPRARPARSNTHAPPVRLHPPSFLLVLLSTLSDAHESRPAFPMLPRL